MRRAQPWRRSAATPAMPPSRRTSCEETPLPKCLQDDVFERTLRVRANVADVVAAAVAFEIAGVRLPCLRVRRGQPRRHLDFAKVAGFDVDEPDFTKRADGPVGLRRDVYDEDIVADRPQDLQPGLEPARIEEVGDDNGQTDLPR